jgi:hypothetical protein
MLKVRFAVPSLGFAMILFPALLAQTPPLPAQILSAKKAFISNTGVGFKLSGLSGTPDRMYNEFYADMKTSGQYELVGALSDADLVLDVSVDSVVWQLKLDMVDPRTGIVLWAQYEPIQAAASQKNRDKNFDKALSKLVSDLKALTAQPAAAAK